MRSVRLQDKSISSAEINDDKSLRYENTSRRPVAGDAHTIQGQQ